MNELLIFVRKTGGDNVTNIVNKIRTSCTTSPEAAARRQAEKLFGPALQRVEFVEEVASSATFKAVADADEFAFVWATGLIEFGSSIKEGALAFARGPARALRKRVEVLARHAKPPSNALLLPGIPEAVGQDAGMDALISFIAAASKTNGKPTSFGVVFEHMRS